MFFQSPWTQLLELEKIYIDIRVINLMIIKSQFQNIFLPLAKFVTSTYLLTYRFWNKLLYPTWTQVLKQIIFALNILSCVPQRRVVAWLELWSLVRHVPGRLVFECRSRWSRLRKIILWMVSCPSEVNDHLKSE